MVMCPALHPTLVCRDKHFCDPSQNFYNVRSFIGAHASHGGTWLQCQGQIKSEGSRVRPRSVRKIRAASNKFC